MNALNIRGLAAGVVVASVGLFAPAAGAATVVVTGPQIGTPGTAGTGTMNPNDPNDFQGTAGGAGYTIGFGDTDSYVFTNVTATGGAGGAVASADADASHNYSGGTGGSGVFVLGNASAPPRATFNSGTFTGAVGGAATGTAAGGLAGGYGGDGVLALGTTAVVNGGTYQGGDSGPAAGDNASLDSGFAGSGINVNNDSSVTVYGGAFRGGNGAVVPGGGTGAAGAGLIGLGGDAFVYGGTFAAGTGNSQGFDIDLYIGTITLYGSDFAVDGVPVTGNTIDGTGVLTGVLANNTSSGSIRFINRDFGGTIYLSPVPEPTSLALLGLGGLSLVRRRRIAAGR